MALGLNAEVAHLLLACGAPICVDDHVSPSVDSLLATFPCNHRVVRRMGQDVDFLKLIETFPDGDTARGRWREPVNNASAG